jgi:hypothetical protein
MAVAITHDDRFASGFDLDCAAEAGAFVSGHLLSPDD